MRMEYLTLVTTDGRLHPVFVTRVAIDRTRADVRAWCSRNEVHLSEYKPAEQDRPWTADVPVDLQAGL
jgi:hypothetical protein